MPEHQLQLWGDEPSDRLRWSISRSKRLRDCTRKYYLFHYGSRGGRAPDAAPRVRETFVLRTLRNRWMWVGEVVHELIELAMTAWRKHESVPVEALVERGTRQMRVQYSESIQAMYRERPGQGFGLREHEYREDVSRQAWRDQRDHMETCLRNFFALPLREEIQNTPRWRWLAVESLGTFELDGATIVVKPDFAWRDEDERVVMVDWKTGMARPEDEKLQLAVYGMFAQRSWGLKHDHFRGQIAYLGSGEVKEYLVTRGDLDEAEETVRESVREMRRRAHNPSGGLLPPLEAFPKTDDSDRCRRCNFERICFGQR